MKTFFHRLNAKSLRRLLHYEVYSTEHDKIFFAAGPAMTNKVMRFFDNTVRPICWNELGVQIIERMNLIKRMDSNR